MQTISSISHGGLAGTATSSDGATRASASLLSPMIFGGLEPSIPLLAELEEEDSSEYSTTTAVDHRRRRLYQYSLLVQDHQEMVNRHSLCLSRIRLAAEEATVLRRENAHLRSFNAELNRRLRLLIRSSVHTRLDSWTMFSAPAAALYDGEKGTEKGRGSTRFWGREGSEESQASTVEVDVFSLPKSVSVKSDDYLKQAQAIVNKGGRSTRNSTRSRNITLQNVKQKLYVGGGLIKKEDEQEQPLELEVHKQGAFKTELCDKWQETGECPYGDQCQFAHGIQELRPIIRHPRYKTQLCRMVLNGAVCPYGHRCHFLHAPLADRQV